MSTTIGNFFRVVLPTPRAGAAVSGISSPRTAAASNLFALTLWVFTSHFLAAAEPVARGAYPDLAIDAQGTMHLVYAREGKLRYRKCEARSNQWGAEQDNGLEQGIVHRSEPEIVIDSQGHPHVFVGGTYGWWDGQAWRAIPVEAQRDTGLAMDARDNVHLVHRGGHAGGHLGLRVRSAGEPRFHSMPDPDIAGGLPLGRNNHVYGDIAINRADGSLHIVYRHGAPRHCSYRTSNDGGRTWAGSGINDDDGEAPSITVGADSRVYVVTGAGHVFRRDGGPDQWLSLGRGLSCGKRDLPQIAVDANGHVYVACFGGCANIWSNGKWRGQSSLANTAAALGFVDLAVAPDGQSIFASWEEGVSMTRPMEMSDPVGEPRIYVARFELQEPARNEVAPKANDRSPPLATVTVGRWDRFQAGVINRKSYRDPFRDVSLDVVYTRPDGSTVKFWGFYDGDSIWNFRFMPDQVGRWKYEAAFSDVSPGLSGSFECVPSNLPGMLSLDEANPMWFGFRGGKHVLIRAFHVGDRFFAANWPDASRARFLDWAGKQGYNMLSIASHYLNREERNRGADWQTPDLWPLNPAEFRRMEHILEDLASRRIMAFPFAGFFGRSSDFPREPAEQELFVRYTLARVGPCWNILLNVGGPEPPLRGKPYLSMDEIHQLGKMIEANDIFNHPLTVHNPTGDDLFRDAAWLDYGTLQGPKTSDLSQLSRGLLKNHHPEKALLAQETLWSGNVNHIRSLKGRDYTDDELRRNTWVIHMSAAALVFADNGGGNSSAGFSGSLDPGEAEQRRHDILKQVWDLAESFPFYRLKPRQDLVDRGYCLAEPGRHYLVYLPAPGAINLKLESGPYQVQWINARDGQDRRSGGTTAPGEPLSSPAEQGEWLLWLTPSS